jgi:hypothetical protein
LQSLGYRALSGTNIASLTVPDGFNGFVGNGSLAGMSKLNAAGILFEGTKIPDYTFVGVPGSAGYAIPAGIKEIGFRAFYGCKWLTSVDLHGLTLVGPSAFAGTGITALTVPEDFNGFTSGALQELDGLEADNIVFEGTRIPDCTFSYFMSMTAYEIPAGITAIGDNAFSGCSSLISVDIPAGVTSIGNSAFSRCTSLASVDMPGVTSIGDSAFYGCTSLASVDIPAGVTGIGDYTFYGCTSLASVDIPVGVASIGDSAFSDCTSLTSVDIPAGMTSIGRMAFYSCTSLISVDISAGVKILGDSVFYKCASLSSVSIPESVTDIGQWAFRGCASLASIDIPGSVTNIGQEAFRDCASLTSVEILGPVETVAARTFSGCALLASVSLPDTVKTIGQEAFDGCVPLAEIDLPASLESLGACAFRGTAIERLAFPEGFDGFFEGNAALPGSLGGMEHLKDVQIGGTLTRISDYMFKSAAMESYVIPDTVTEIGAYAFMNCSALTSIKIPDGVRSIGEYAFEGCASLTDVDLTKIETIGNFAFRGCASLTKLSLPPSLKMIGEYAFQGTGITELFVPSSVTGQSRFRDMPQLEKIVFESGFTRLTNWELIGCTSLTEVVLPDTLLSIENFAFASCSSLEEIVLPPSLLNLYSYVIRGTGVEHLSIPPSVTGFAPPSIAASFDGASNLRAVRFEEGRAAIQADALRDAAAVDRVLVPRSVKEIPAGAFADCDAGLKLCGHADNIYAIEYAKSEGLPYAVLPEIETEKLDEAYLYIPYWLQIEANVMSGVTFALAQGSSLPAGLSLSPDGVISGAPLAHSAEPYRFTVTVTSDDVGLWPDEAEFTLTIHERPTDAVLEQQVNDYPIEAYMDKLIAGYSDEVTDQIFKTPPSFGYFLDFWINGVKQVRDVAYTAREGSTVVTLLKRTIQELDNGVYTAVAEFSAEGEHKVVGQNFTVNLLERPPAKPDAETPPAKPDAETPPQPGEEMPPAKPGGETPGESAEAGGDPGAAGSENKAGDANDGGGAEQEGAESNSAGSSGQGGGAFDTGGGAYTGNAPAGDAALSAEGGGAREGAAKASDGGTAGAQAQAQAGADASEPASDTNGAGASAGPASGTGAVDGLPRDANGLYYFVLDGSGRPFEVRVDIPFAAFEALYFDGAPWTRGADYETREGSTVLTIAAERLALLALGMHGVDARFAEGRRVAFTFDLRRAEPAEGAEKDGAADASGGPAENAAATGGTPRLPAVPVALFAIAAVLLLAAGLILRAQLRASRVKRDSA